MKTWLRWQSVVCGVVLWAGWLGGRVFVEASPLDPSQENFAPKGAVQTDRQAPRRDTDVPRKRRRDLSRDGAGANAAKTAAAGDSSETVKPPLERRRRRFPPSDQEKVAQRLAQTLLRGHTLPGGFVLRGVNEQGRAEFVHTATRLEFVHLPGGEFWMGGHETRRLNAHHVEDDSFPDDSLPDEFVVGGPRHRVRLGPFLIAKYEVSGHRWSRVMGRSSPRRSRAAPTRGGSPTGGESSAYGVTWTDAQAFCRKTGLQLPTEAQWEYACRAGTETPYWFGEAEDHTLTNARLGRVWDDGPVRGEFIDPNGFGLYHMHGNVSEWCRDNYDPDAYRLQGAAGPDPLCIGSTVDRVVRGGSWISPLTMCGSASRSYGDTRGDGQAVGLRPVYDLTAPQRFSRYPVISGVPEVNDFLAFPQRFGFRLRGLNSSGYLSFEHVPTRHSMVLLPGGTFSMGLAAAEAARVLESTPPALRSFVSRALAPEQPAHSVTLSPFLMATWEVPYLYPSRRWMLSAVVLPLKSFSWSRAATYCEHAGLALPTEAQWEYACRAPREALGNHDVGDRTIPRGWTRTNRNGRTEAANPFGLQDIRGYHPEWCQDVYDPEFYQKPEASGRDPVATTGSSRHVYRGGHGWSSEWNWAPQRRFSAVDSEPRELFPHHVATIRPAFPLRGESQAVWDAIHREKAALRHRRRDGVEDPLGAFTLVGENPGGYPEYRHQATGILFVRLPGGAVPLEVFEESETPARIHLSPFLLAKYELTTRQWRDVMGWDFSTRRREDYPVTDVTWQDCEEFCRQTGLELPSETQWAYACSTGATDDLSPELSLDPTTPDRLLLRPVESLSQNTFGLHGLLGNVREWCADNYRETFAAAAFASVRDPIYRNESNVQTLRSPGPRDGDSLCSWREKRFRSSADAKTGFRPALTLTESN